MRGSQRIHRFSRRANLGVCAVGAVLLAIAPGDVEAQTSPRGASVSFPTALRAADGRVRRAWGFEEAAPGPPVLAARGFLSRHAHLLQLGDVDRLRHVRSIVAHGTTYVRFTDTRFGGPVMGSSAVVAIRSGVATSVSLSRADLPSEGARRVSVEAMDEAARQEVPGARVVSSVGVGAIVDGHIVPAQAVELAGAELHQRERVRVDARDGRVIDRHARLHHAQGRVYPSDPVTDEEMTADVELLHLTSRTRLTGRYFRVASCDADGSGCQRTAFASPDEAGDFLYEPVEPAFNDGFAEVNAYHHADRVAAYFRETHGFTWRCGANELMDVTVNYTEAAGVPFDNAGYAPSIGPECGFMIFGQGAVDFAYDADVVYHEFGHAVVDQTTELEAFILEPLGVSYAPGAINEGVADYVAATLSDDPRMAAYFASQPLAGEGALRRLDNTLRCPDDQVGEVHFDGRLWAGLLWDVRESVGAERADAMMFAALAALEVSPSLSDAAEVLAMIAVSFETEGRLSEEERGEVQGLIEARGLLGCERIVPLDDGMPHLAFSGVNATAGSGARIAPVQFRLDVPADTRAVRLVVRPSGAGTFRLHVRSTQPPQVVGARVEAAQVLELDDEHQARLELPDLVRCETLYIAVETVDLASIGAALFEVEAELEGGGTGGCGASPDAGDMGQLDAGPLDAGPAFADSGSDTLVPGGGCQCDVRSSRTAPPLWLVVVLVGAIGYRRVRG
ncbi:MAG: hypothetical protein AB8I08_32250 [Sandaracinaceae bacterium]